MVELGRFRLRLLAFGAAAIAAGSFVTMNSLEGAEARLADEASPAIVAYPSAPDCGPACSSHVVAAAYQGGEALVVPGASAFGMALDAGAARLDNSPAILQARLGASAEIGFAMSGGASAIYEIDLNGDQQLASAADLALAAIPPQ